MSFLWRKNQKIVTEKVELHSLRYLEDFWRIFERFRIMRNSQNLQRGFKVSSDFQEILDFGRLRDIRNIREVREIREIRKKIICWQD